MPIFYIPPPPPPPPHPLTPPQTPPQTYARIKNSKNLNIKNVNSS